jgi:hypothetical protein
VFAVAEDAGQILFELAGERLERFDPAVDGPVVPVVPEQLRVAGVAVVPQLLEVVLEDADLGQRLVGRQQFGQPDPVVVVLDVADR